MSSLAEGPDFDACFAHSSESADKTTWQRLGDHLEAVASRAADFAEKFDAAAWGRAAGLLHDLGKCSAEFQRRLEGGPRVDHATAGAHVAIARFGPALGRLLAYVVAGHHSGLPDGGSRAALEPRSLAHRLTQKTPALPPFASLLHGLPALALPRDLRPQAGAEGFSAAFFTRMVFSCLTDADFLDTEAWLAEGRARLRTRGPALASLSERLDAHLEALGHDDRAINRHRARVLAQCRAAAALPPGLFSLTVPTGGGKTLASLSFALRHAVTHGLARVIYVIPYTSIIEQNAAVFRAALGDPDRTIVLEHHSNYREPEDADTENALRMRLAAENWDAPLVVTTNVQFFESLFAARSSRCRRLHNVTRSVVILDEAQMLPLGLLQPCLRALRELARNYGTTVVLCTATQPALHRSAALPCGFDDDEVHEIVPDHATLYAALKRVEVGFAGDLADQEVARRIRADPQVLCVVNTRAHARRLFEALGDTEGLVHLSALLCPAHRAVKLADVRARLAAGLPCRVISTQLVEAGVDVDFPVVLRAAAGVDSIAQAAGRCNREGRLPGPGRVTVFFPQGGLPAGHFRRSAEVGHLTARAFPDLLAPPAVEHYFRTLYSFEGEAGLDRSRVLARLEENATALSFPFRTVGEEFRLIDTAMESLVVPWGEEARGVIRELRVGAPPWAAARRLQPFTVQVPERTLAALMAAGVVETVAGQFHCLSNEHIYREDLGLCPEDPTFREQEDNVL